MPGDRYLSFPILAFDILCLMDALRGGSNAIFPNVCFFLSGDFNDQQWNITSGQKIFEPLLLIYLLFLYLFVARHTSGCNSRGL